LYAVSTLIFMKSIDLQLFLGVKLFLRNPMEFAAVVVFAVIDA